MNIIQLLFFRVLVHAGSLSHWHGLFRHCNSEAIVIHYFVISELLLFSDVIESLPLPEHQSPPHPIQ